MQRFPILGAAFLAFAFLLLLALPASTTSAQAATECQPEIVKGRSSHWSYRLIDGRKCWYEGKNQIPKSELYWPDQTGSAGRKVPPAEAAPAAQAAVPPAPANPPATNAQGSSPAIENEAFTDPEDGSCCWPPRKEGDSFEARWQSLGLKPQD